MSIGLFVPLVSLIILIVIEKGGLAVLSKKEVVSLVLLGLSQHYKKHYCYPTQVKILDLCGKFYDCQMSRRTLNRVLKGLVDDKIIWRTRRHKNGGPDGMLFRSTLYRFKGKIFNWLYSLAKRVKWLFSFYRVPKWAQYKVTPQPLLVGFGGLRAKMMGTNTPKGRASP